MNLRTAGIVSSIACILFSAAAADEPVRKTVKAADGLPIVCEVRGKGNTALVFIHGWGGDREYWKNQLGVFDKDYQVVTVDQAGFGESGTDRKEWSVAALAADVEAVVKELGLKRVVLVGHSMGGPVSLLAAKRMPGTVVAVVGVDTMQNAEFKFPEGMRTQILDGMRKDFKRTVGGMFGGMLAEKSDPALKKWLGDKAAARDPTIATALISDLFAGDLKKAFQEAKVPVRCINSAGGYPFFQPTAADVNKKYADFDAVLIDEVGHYPMLEKPAEFNRKLGEVLKELAAKK